MDASVGDKVRLKDGHLAGRRGVVEAVEYGMLLVRVDGGDQRISVAASAVTNYSLASRKAWKSMPSRRVGRPKGSRHSDRVSVTLRFDREIWDQFRKLEAAGLIQDRTATVNSWLQAMLDGLENGVDNTERLESGTADH